MKRSFRMYRTSRRTSHLPSLLRPGLSGGASAPLVSACGWRQFALAGCSIGTSRRFGNSMPTLSASSPCPRSAVWSAPSSGMFSKIRALMHHPFTVLFDRAGFAWFGGLVAGIPCSLWQGRGNGIGRLAMLDLAASRVGWVMVWDGLAVSLPAMATTASRPVCPGAWLPPMGSCLPTGSARASDADLRVDRRAVDCLDLWRRGASPAAA